MFSVSEAEDECAYGILAKAFIDKTGVNPVQVSTCAAKCCMRILLATRRNALLPRTAPRGWSLKLSLPSLRMRQQGAMSARPMKP